MLTAPEWTVEIPPMRVPRVCQEANGTVTAVDRTACQTAIIAQDRIERSLILTNKRTSAIVLMPIRAKTKEFPGGYNKNARFSVKMLISFDTPSSYELDAQASRSRARFFCESAQKICARIAQRIHPPRSLLLPQLVQPRFLCPATQSATWKRRISSNPSEDGNLLLFPVVDPFS